ncbi:MAG: His/Gly/Thr/Pro-type tRNA ligase C-terminal domain-containing protein, partial [Bacillota bacterium]|nr:His/Gly/Thr/Pro-type tRNA ligase C-terminal domain-containing protein [Bacillota bacterium]
NSPGWKFNEYEMKGIPLRLEVGPRDIENGKVVYSIRHSGEKSDMPREGAVQAVKDMLERIHREMYEKAQKSMEEKTFVVTDYESFKQRMEEKPGIAKAMWCGCSECEEKIKNETAVTIRCIPFEQENLGDTCPFCGKEAKHMVVLGKAY